MCAAEAKQYGFTLAEVAVVLLIVGLLLGGLLGTYSTQIELSRTAETKKTLETARDALMRDARIVVDDSTITSHIKRIRKKFVALDPAFNCITTVYGMGYRWNAEA